MRPSGSGWTLRWWPCRQSGWLPLPIHDGFESSRSNRLPHGREPPILWIGSGRRTGTEKKPCPDSCQASAAKNRACSSISSTRLQWRNTKTIWPTGRKRSKRRTPPEEPIATTTLSVDDTTVEATATGSGGKSPRGRHHQGRIGQLACIVRCLPERQQQGWQLRTGRTTASFTREARSDSTVWKKAHMYVPHWGASIVGNIQPGPVKRLMGNITDDGLVARFLVAHCERSGRGIDRAPDYTAIGTYDECNQNAGRS